MVSEYLAVRGPARRIHLRECLRTLRPAGIFARGSSRPPPSIPGSSAPSPQVDIPPYGRRVAPGSGFVSRLRLPTVILYFKWP